MNSNSWQARQHTGYRQELCDAVWAAVTADPICGGIEVVGLNLKRPRPPPARQTYLARQTGVLFATLFSECVSSPQSEQWPYHVGFVVVRGKLNIWLSG